MATVLDLVRHYQHAIEKYPNDEQKVLKSIDKLFNLDVTVQHLQETGVGRTVNALRKEPGEVGHAARALVYKWKLMVAAEESDQDADHNTDTSTYNGHENGRDSDENVKQSSKNNKYDSYDKPTPNIKNEQKELNGNYSGAKRRHHSSEEEEPDVKKSRHSGNSNNYNDYKRKPEVSVKREPESEDESDTDRSHSEDSDSDGSESSREQKVIKIKQEIKQEPTDNHKSSTSKQSSSHKSSGDHKKELSSSKRLDDSEKHSKRHHSSEPADRHSYEKSLTKDKSHSSHKHKSSKDKDKSDKNLKSERSPSEKDKKHKEEYKSSSKHKSSSDKHKSSHSENSSEKNKSDHEKHSSKSEKQRSSSHSQKSEKEKRKSSSEKEISDDKHKSKYSSSSKEKHSSSSKERSKDRSSSSKEKTDGSKENHHSHKSEKKQTSSSDSKSKHSDSKNKSEKHDEGGSETKSKHKSSSSSSHKSKSSSSKSKEDVPKKKTNSSADSDDGIDCGSGASFAEALGMVSPAKPKKKPVPMASPSINKDLSPASLLAPTAKLSQLPLSLPLEISALPDISPNYKPRPPPKLMPHLTEEEALSSVISSKNQRTKVYSGNKVIGKIPTLYEMCVQILQEHIDALEYTGGVPYDILKPVVDKATPQQLFMLEHYNPYLMDDTDHLWEKHTQKNFRNKQRQEMETWREMYLRCQEEQEHRLKSLTANIRMTQEAKKAPIKQTKMAYVDSIVKPPRNVARKQALHGTAHAATASPAARVAALAAAPNVLRGGARAAPAPLTGPSACHKPKKAPLMQKALQFMRGRKR